MFWCPVCGRAPLIMMYCVAFCLQPWLSPLICSFFNCSLEISLSYNEGIFFLSVCLFYTREGAHPWGFSYSSDCISHLPILFHVSFMHSHWKESRGPGDVRCLLTSIFWTTALSAFLRRLAGFQEHLGQTPDPLICCLLRPLGIQPAEMNYLFSSDLHPLNHGSAFLSREVCRSPGILKSIWDTSAEVNKLEQPF